MEFLEIIDAHIEGAITYDECVALVMLEDGGILSEREVDILTE